MKNLSPNPSPIRADEFSPQWIANVREAIARDGHATRPGSGAWIEVQNPNQPEVWQPLNLPSNGILFASATDRDQVLEQLVGKEKKSDPEIYATVVQKVTGKICTFAVGEVVKVDWDDGITCAIQRREWQEPRIPIVNCLAGVPRYMLRFGDPTQ